MKKKYFVPEVEITWVRIEDNFVATGENLSRNTSYSSYDEGDFWN